MNLITTKLSDRVKISTLAMLQNQQCSNQSFEWNPTKHLPKLLAMHDKLFEDAGFQHFSGKSVWSVSCRECLI